MKFLLEKKIPNPWPDNFWEFVSEPLDLDYLKWVHEDMKVPLTSGAFWGPATYGMLDMVKYLLEKNCPWDGKTVMLLKESHAEVTDESDNIIGLRETNTMPQWAGSCWYFLRFTDPNNTENAWSKDNEKYWMPVDLYIGGQEHAVLHLLYLSLIHI